MKFIYDMMHKSKPLFEKDGKLARLYPLYEGGETFLFVKPTRTTIGSHIRDAVDSKRYMTVVIVALLLPFLFGMYNVGFQQQAATVGWDAAKQHGLVATFLLGARYMLPLVIVSYVVGGIWEVIFAVWRKHEINEGFLVTGLLYPLVLPPTLPWWQAAVGISFGVVIGKEVFGGTGMNVFNPALVARATVFFAYGKSMTGDKAWVDTAKGALDGYSGATPLAYVANHGTSEGVVSALNHFGTTAAGVKFADYSLWNMFVGLIPGSMGETSKLAILIGALVLIITGVGSWRIMVSCVAGLLSLALLCSHWPHVSASDKVTLPWIYHLMMGGFAFGTVYMATDPVSAAATNLGKWIYGFCIGALVIVVRLFNPAYPEGVMLAILMMNAFAPLIDYVIVQRHIDRRLELGQAV